MSYKETRREGNGGFFNGCLSVSLSNPSGKASLRCCAFPLWSSSATPLLYCLCLQPSAVPLSCNPPTTTMADGCESLPSNPSSLTIPSLPPLPPSIAPRANAKFSRPPQSTTPEQPAWPSCCPIFEIFSTILPRRPGSRRIRMTTIRRDGLRCGSAVLMGSIS